MAADCLSVFVDTNCFIHLRDLADLDWSVQFPGYDSFEIVIVPVVVDELDRLKTEREDRRRARARLALQLIESASNAEGFRCSLRDPPNEITLRLAAGGRVDWSSWPILDPSRPDDQLVAAALAEKCSGKRVLLSFDTGPLIRARMCRLEARRSPVEWQLQEQIEGSNRRIASLERELALIKENRPKISVEFVDEMPSGKLLRSVYRLPQLSLKTRKALTAELLRRSPKQILKVYSTNRLLWAGLGSGYSEATVTEYENKYKEFEESAFAFFETLHKRIRQASMVPEIAYQICNDGVATAANLLAEFRCGDGLKIFGSEEDAQPWRGPLFPPRPPKVPQNSLSRHLGHSIYKKHQDAPRDPTQFYWQNRPSEESASASEICAEFRPGRSHCGSYWIAASYGKPANGPLQLDISATNLSEPTRLEVELLSRDRDTQWHEDEVLELLQNWMSEIIKSGA